MFNRLTYLWLLIAIILFPFATGRWVIPVALWIAPLFLIRYMKSSEGIWRYVGSYIVLFVGIAIGFHGTLANILFYLIVAFFALLMMFPYFIHLILSLRFRGFLSTLVFPFCYVALEYIESLIIPYGSWMSHAYTQYGNQTLHQIISVTGLWALIFIIMWLNAVVDWAWDRQFKLERIWRGSMVFLLVVACVPLFGALRLVLFSHSLPESSHTDGTIASLKLLSYPGQSSHLNIYKIFYWSQGEKVEMYALVPRSKDTKLLFVECHGGYDTPGGPRQSPYTLKDIAFDHTTKAVTIFPEYSGYGGSQGKVKGLSSNALDVENAITAVNSLKNVTVQKIRIEGVSMGGAVALMVASNTHYAPTILNIILVSPFPGWEVAEIWDEKNKKSTVPGASQERQVKADGSVIYGPFAPTSRAYKINSPALSRIKVPVLLLQGTNDQLVPWQMTRMLYQDLKNYGVNATLDLVPGGNHGLTGGSSSTAESDAVKWLQHEH